MYSADAPPADGDVSSLTIKTAGTGETERAAPAGATKKHVPHSVEETNRVDTSQF